MRRAFIGGFLLVAFQAAAPAQTSTSTTLAVTSEGGAVTTVSSGSAVTLTATVTAGATPVTVGQVSFCDATAQSCADIHLLGMAKLRGAGTATLKFLPPIGSHSYKAIFAGAPNSALHAAASSSSGAALTVTGLSPTETTITQSGFAGNYTVTATVGGVGGTAPTGTVSILNASDGNAGLGSAALSAGTAELNFLNSSSLSLASDSTPVAVGDFNGDGLPDIAIATAALSNSVTVCLSDGHGNFTPAPAVNLGTVFVDSLATGDFNGDGVLDLAVGSSVAGTITTLLGNGDGTFKVMGSASTGGAFPSFVVGDFNGDGIPDLGVLNTTAETVTLLLGSGDGTFSPSTASASATSTDPLLITAGDFNGDGVLDLAILNGAPTGDVGTVTVLLGNGDGTFAATAVSPSAGGETPASIVVADFNGDGILDLAIADGPPNDDLQATATILLGSGDGTFITSSASPVVISQGIASLADHLAVGDFNGDGKADLIVEDEDIGASILMLGNGDGTFRFAQGTVSNADGFPIYVAVGDFNGDGWTDLVGEGKVLFAVDETSTATATGIAVPMATGTQQVAGRYAGDNTYQPSVSSTIGLQAVRGTPVISLTASPNPATAGAPVTFTATLAVSGPAPTGTVSFYAGSNALGTGTLNSSGVATFTANGLTTGQYSLTASYEGDADYASATSPAVVLSVAGSPLPVINSMSPAFASAGGSALTLTITGAGFVSGSTVYWGATALSTQFASATQLAAQVTAGDIANAGTSAITVQTPTPGGGTSNSLQFEVDSAGSESTAPTFTSSTATVAAGSTVSYAVTLPSTVTNASVTCLNLPTGATCSYSSAAKTATIATTSATPAGTYQVTVIFTESVPGAAAGFVLLPILLLPLVTIRKRLTAGGTWIMACLGIVFLLAAVSIGCGGGSSTGSGNQTHQVKSSGVVTLIVQ